MPGNFTATPITHLCLFKLLYVYKKTHSKFKYYNALLTLFLYIKVIYKRSVNKNNMKNFTSVSGNCKKVSICAQKRIHGAKTGAIIPICKRGIPIHVRQNFRCIH